AKPAAKKVAAPAATAKPASSKTPTAKSTRTTAPATPTAKPSAAKAAPTPKTVAATPQEKPVPAPKSPSSNAPAKPVPTAPGTPGKVAVAVVSKKTDNVSPAPTRRKVVEYKIDEATGRPILPAGYKPSADEEYMNPLQLEYFRQRLLQWRADLVEESKQTIENLKEEVRDIGDEAERATRETENSLELRTRDRYRKLIGKIDSTLKRVDSGEYGICVDTDEEIGLERMEARLTEERGIDAQERWEHSPKLMGGRAAASRRNGKPRYGGAFAWARLGWRRAEPQTDSAPEGALPGTAMRRGLFAVQPAL